MKSNTMDKSCNVVMLPTQSKAVRLGQLVIGAGNNLFSSRQSNDIGSLTAYELYITSDEEIKVGDWFYYEAEKTIMQCTEHNFYFTPELIQNYSNVYRIIVTTDTSLKLPNISQQFIEKYIEEYNKGNVITKVEVEYEDLTEQLQESVDNLRDNCLEDFDNEEESPYYHLLEQAIIELGNYIPKLKINPDNTINIKPIKDSWSREEVHKLLYNAIHYSKGKVYPHDLEWIEENL